MNEADFLNITASVLITLPFGLGLIFRGRRVAAQRAADDASAADAALPQAERIMRALEQGQRATMSKMPPRKK